MKLAFANAFVGVNHALAHATGARFGIAHGRANGIFLPHVLRYNASLPSKFMPAPGYTSYAAPDKYAQAGWVFGLGGRSGSDVLALAHASFPQAQPVPASYCRGCTGATRMRPLNRGQPQETGAFKWPTATA